MTKIYLYPSQKLYIKREESSYWLGYVTDDDGFEEIAISPISFKELKNTAIKRKLSQKNK